MIFHSKEHFTYPSTYIANRRSWRSCCLQATLYWFMLLWKQPSQSTKMAATTSRQRSMPLLRRPLPPKPIPKPASSTFYLNEDEKSTARSKSPTVSTRTRSRPKASRSEQQYHGDIALPNTSVVQPYRPRGPPPLPPRQPRKVRELPPAILDSYTKPPPAFTLKNFSLRIPSRCGEEEHREIMISDQNYQKLTSWLTANRPKQSQIHSLELDTSIQVPDVTPRIPPRHLSIEMSLPVADMEFNDSPDYYGYADNKIPKGTPVTPAVSKQTYYSRQRPPLPPIEQSAHEDFSGADHIYQADTQEEPLGAKYEGVELTDGTQLESNETHERNEIRTAVKTKEEKGNYVEQEMKYDHYSSNQTETEKNMGKQKINFKEDIEESFEFEEGVIKVQEDQEHWIQQRGLTFDQFPAITYRDLDVVLPSSAPVYYQGEALPRTMSPFATADNDDTQITPLEAVILNALMTESVTLNIKAHFLSELPTLNQLSDHLTHLNASFNDFWVFPPEILDLNKLVSLRLRNNPIKEIPHEICNLKQLKVLDMSFNLLSSLPKCLFELKDLEILDMCYNRISFIPTEIGNLRCLRELSVEGNQIRALPVTALRLPLRHLRVANNIIHPLFWRETASNQPQRLLDLCALTVNKTEQDSLKMAILPDSIKSYLKSPGKCDCCGSVKYGQGLRVIKSPDEIFGVKNLPFLFTVCSQRCRKTFIKNKDAIELWLLRNNIVIKKQ